MFVAVGVALGAAPQLYTLQPTRELSHDLNYYHQPHMLTIPLITYNERLVELVGGVVGVGAEVLALDLELLALVAVVDISDRRTFLVLFSLRHSQLRRRWSVRIRIEVKREL